MTDTRQYNLLLVAQDAEETHRNEIASLTMNKCTTACFMSLKESHLLPTEERCLRNCFVKSGGFNKYFTPEFTYAIR